MKAINVLNIDGKKLLYCVGDDVPDCMGCKKIRIHECTLDIIKTSYYTSLTGDRAALLQIQAEPDQRIPLGDVTILE